MAKLGQSSLKEALLGTNKNRKMPTIASVESSEHAPDNTNEKAEEKSSTMHEHPRTIYSNSFQVYLERVHTRMELSPEIKRARDDVIYKSEGPTHGGWINEIHKNDAGVIITRIHRKHRVLSIDMEYLVKSEADAVLPTHILRSTSYCFPYSKIVGVEKRIINIVFGDSGLLITQVFIRLNTKQKVVVFASSKGEWTGDRLIDEIKREILYE